MEVESRSIPGLKIIRPRVFEDSRGWFFESYNKALFDKEVTEVNFVQDNESYSTFGVVRGLHFQKPPYAQAKLVRCVRGAVLDIAVDIRRGSPTYGSYEAVMLTGENRLQFYIPRGFAHGFAVLSDDALFQYKCDNFYTPGSEGGIRLDDPDLGIDWRVDLKLAILSDKDKTHPAFANFISPFIYGENS